MSLPTHDEIMADEFGREVRVECTQCWKVEHIVEDTRKKRGYWDSDPDEYICQSCKEANAERQQVRQFENYWGGY